MCSIERYPAVERVGLVGLRLGASIVALFAESVAGDTQSRLRDAPLVLWDAVLDGEAIFRKCCESTSARNSRCTAKCAKTARCCGKGFAAAAR